MKTKTTERFETAVTKLYNAYHSGKLSAFKCHACAVGTLVGHGDWDGYNFRLDFCSNDYPNTGDYAGYYKEIEKRFLQQFQTKNKWSPIDGNNKEAQFKGLCAVIEYLAELDGLENPFDFSELFNEDKQKAAKELNLIKV